MKRFETHLIETAPKDGTEIPAWSEWCGWFMARWECSEQDTSNEGWFCADFVCGYRLSDNEAPTHWTELPPDPVCTTN